MRSALVVGVGVVALSVGFAPVMGAAPSSASTSGCPAVVLVAAPGTWETNPHASGEPVGLLADVAHTLEGEYGAKFDSQFVAYDARAFDGGVTYGESKAGGVAAMDAAVAEWSTKCPAAQLLLAGYSQGAAAAGDVASSIGCAQKPTQPSRVLAVGLVSDPNNGTAGGKPVGASDGAGIAGARDAGFCALSAVTAEICAPGDLYCSTDAHKNPLIASLGKVLGAAPGTPEAAQAEGLVSPVDRQTLDALPENLATLTDPESDRAGVPAAAQSATKALTGLGQTREWAQRPEVAPLLADAKPGSPEAGAAKFLESGLDVSGAVESIQKIAAPGSPLTAIGEAASRLSSQVEPVTADQGWAATSGALAILQPQTVIDQVLNVATNSVDFAVNLPKILDKINAVGVVLANPHDMPTKVRELRDVFRELNVLFEPLVTMAAGVDLHLVSGLLGAASVLDSTGITSIVSAVVGLAGNVDVQRVAGLVGELQELLWRLAEGVASGDPAVAFGAAFEAAGSAVPMALSFVTVAVDALSGAPKRSTGGCGAGCVSVSPGMTAWRRWGRW